MYVEMWLVIVLISTAWVSGYLFAKSGLTFREVLGFGEKIRKS